jgi:putative SOS response-associated peptidase YedK
MVSPETVAGLARRFGIQGTAPLPPRPEVAPSDPVLAVRRAADRQGREFVWLRWGLIPAGANDAKVGSRLINARAENAAERPSFRDAFRHRRCLVLADSFLVWQRAESKKRPYRVGFRDGRPFGMAGLWERWHDSGGAEVESCAVLTVPANGVVRPFQARMPAILEPGDYDAWLDPGIHDPQRLWALLRPYPDGALVAEEVGPKVRGPRPGAGDSPEPTVRPKSRPANEDRFLF